MKEALQRLQKEHVPDPERVELEKYISLLHILKGQEEFVLDADGYIIGSNLEAVNVTGYEEYEVLGKHISLFYLPEEAQKANSDLEKAIAIGTVYVTGLRVKKRAVGFWAKMKIEHLHATRTKAPNFKVVLQDATHRALSKARVRTIKDEYLALFNNPFVGTYKFRMDDFSMQVCNRKLLDIVGCEDSNTLRFESLFFSAAQFQQFIELLRQEKKVEGFRFQIRDRLNSPANWAIVSARVFESQGFAEGVLLDISEQHNQMLELQRVNAELDNFTYHASHDLRAPLTTIMGLVNLGMKETNTETLHHYLALINGRIGHLDTLLKDLISVSYNHKEEVECSIFDFQTEIKKLIDSLTPHHPNTEAELFVYQKRTFRSDAARLRVILRNLLINAYSYFQPDVAVHSVKVFVTVNEKEVQVKVQDNGIGIAPIYQDKVFDMFFHASPRSKGNGLGLYIVKSMIDKLKGHIAFDSTPNVGSTFSVTIPNGE